MGRIKRRGPKIARMGREVIAGQLLLLLHPFLPLVTSVASRRDNNKTMQDCCLRAYRQQRTPDPSACYTAICLLCKKTVSV